MGYQNSMISWKMSAIALVIFSAVMASVVSKLEANFNFVASHAMIMPMSYTGVPQKPAEDIKLDNSKEILRDSFLLSWIIGGCIPGACVGIWIRALTQVVQIAKTFGVSLFTSFCASPWIIKNYFQPSPETCLLVGFMIAVLSWLAWEIALIIITRMKAAAIKNGWMGVKGELAGGSSDGDAKPPESKPVSS